MKNTQLEVKKSQMQITTETVRDLLKFDEFEYNCILFELGMKFIESIYKIDSPEYIHHSRSKMYWSWYRMQFDQCAAFYLNNAAALAHVQNMKQSILIRLFMNDMTFFACKSRSILMAFENYLNADKRYGKRSGKRV